MVPDDSAFADEHATRYHKLGGNSRSSQFLDSRGFGWLLETNDDDDDMFQKPLLLVCFLKFRVL
jgi:hypothetical protein